MRKAKLREIRKARYLKNKSIRIIKRRQKINKYRKRKNLKLKKKGIMNVKKRNILITYLKDRKFQFDGKIRNTRNVGSLAIPKVFSFINNPDETIETLRKLVSMGTMKHIYKIEIDHSKCEELEIGASAVMDIILLSLQHQKKSKGKELSFSGKLPNNKYVREILFVSGVLNTLRVYGDLQVPDSVEKLDLIHGGKDKMYIFNTDNYDSGKATTKITEYIIKCLNKQGFDLNLKGIGLLSSMISEVIDNSEQHSGNFSQWYAIGHFSMTGHYEYGECMLSLFNFGDTIYEGLKNNTENGLMKMDLINMSKKHRKFFQKDRWSEDVLWTLYSLQEGVSRLRDPDKSPDRGNGTITLIHSFQEIGNTYHGKKAEMSVTSGNAHVIFDDKYRLEDKDIEQFGIKEKRAVIAFNKENDLNIPPDKENVKRIKNFFPGTIISMKFYIDKEFLTEKINIMKVGES